MGRPGHLADVDTFPDALVTIIQGVEARGRQICWRHSMEALWEEWKSQEEQRHIQGEQRALQEVE